MKHRSTPLDEIAALVIVMLAAVAVLALGVQVWRDDAYAKCRAIYSIGTCVSLIR